MDKLCLKSQVGDTNFVSSTQILDKDLGNDKDCIVCKVRERVATLEGLSALVLGPAHSTDHIS